MSLGSGHYLNLLVGASNPQSSQALQMDTDVAVVQVYLEAGRPEANVSSIQHGIPRI